MNFERKEFVKLEPWMKRGTKVITPRGNGIITYVRKHNNEVLNFYVNHDLFAAWAVKQDNSK